MFTIQSHQSVAHGGTSRHRTHQVLRTVAVRDPLAQPGVQKLARAVIIDAIALALDLAKPHSNQDGNFVEWCRNVKAGQGHLSVACSRPSTRPP